MANMGYCRFRNTLSDLRDCYENWTEEDEGGSPLSDEERRARERLLELCQNIVGDFSDEMEWS